MPGNSGISLKFPTSMNKLHAACLKKYKSIHALLNRELYIINRMTKQFEIASHNLKSIYENFCAMQ